MKQTAVDFVFEKLASQGLLVTKDFKNLVAYREAKEMEKEQIEEAFFEGLTTPDPVLRAKKTPEQYYNETFNTKRDENR